jgi:hypothetical protein
MQKTETYLWDTLILAGSLAHSVSHEINQIRGSPWDTVA